MKSPTRRTTSIAVLIIMAVFTAWVVGRRALDRRQAAEMLNIAELPASVSDIDCASYGFTDVLESCAYKIVPADFNALLRGYRYIEPAPCGSKSLVGVTCVDPLTPLRTSHYYGGGPAVGRDFVVAHYYVATPKEFEHGGNVTVLTNANRSAVMVELYIE